MLVFDRQIPTGPARQATISYCLSCAQTDGVFYPTGTGLEGVPWTDMAHEQRWSLGVVKQKFCRQYPNPSDPVAMPANNAVVNSTGVSQTVFQVVTSGNTPITTAHRAAYAQLNVGDLMTFNGQTFSIIAVSPSGDFITGRGPSNSAVGVTGKIDITPLALVPQAGWTDFVNENITAYGKKVVIDLEFHTPVPGDCNDPTVVARACAFISELANLLRTVYPGVTLWGYFSFHVRVAALQAYLENPNASTLATLNYWRGQADLYGVGGLPDVLDGIFIDCYPWGGVGSVSAATEATAILAEAERWGKKWCQPGRWYPFLITSKSPQWLRNVDGLDPGTNPVTPASWAGNPTLKQNWLNAWALPAGFFGSMIDQSIAAAGGCGLWGPVEPVTQLTLQTAPMTWHTEARDAKRRVDATNRSIT